MNEQKKGFNKVPYKMRSWYFGFLFKLALPVGQNVYQQKKVISYDVWRSVVVYVDVEKNEFLSISFKRNDIYQTGALIPSTPDTMTDE